MGVLPLSSRHGYAPSKNADQILILDKGSIVERGTHESLLALNGAYTRLYDLQLREQEEFETRMLSVENKDSLYGSNVSQAPVEEEKVGRDRCIASSSQEPTNQPSQKREVTR